MKCIWILFRSNWDFQTFPLCQIFKVCLVSANLNSSVTDFRAVSWLGSGTSSARVRSVLVTFVSFISVCVADNADTGWHNGRVWQLLTYFDSNPENVLYWDVRLVTGAQCCSVWPWPSGEEWRLIERGAIMQPLVSTIPGTNRGRWLFFTRGGFYLALSPKQTNPIINFHFHFRFSRLSSPRSEDGGGPRGPHPRSRGAGDPPAVRPRPGDLPPLQCDQIWRGRQYWWVRSHHECWHLTQDVASLSGVASTAAVKSWSARSWFWLHLRCDYAWQHPVP